MRSWIDKAHSYLKQTKKLPSRLAMPGLLVLQCHNHPALTNPLARSLRVPITTDPRHVSRHPFPTSALIAPAAMPMTITTDMPPCNNMSILAVRVSGNASVGLNAKFVVKPMNR